MDMKYHQLFYITIYFLSTINVCNGGQKKNPPVWASAECLGTFSRVPLEGQYDY